MRVSSGHLILELNGDDESSTDTGNRIGCLMVEGSERRYYRVFMVYAL